MTHSMSRGSAIAIIVALGAFSMTARHAIGADGTEIAFPRDPAVIDLRSEFGAKGDGKTDDTEALQKAIDASCGIGGAPTRVLLIRNGIYLVTRTLVVKSELGPWIYGESRDGAVIRLADGAKDCKTRPADPPQRERAYLRRLVHAEHPMDTRAYLVRLKDRAAGVTISDLTLRGPQVHGAIHGWENKDLHVYHDTE